MPTISAHLPDNWALQREFDAVVDKHYRGRPGPYLRDLVEKDLRGLSIGTPQSAFTIDELAAMRAADTALLRASLLVQEWMFADEKTKPAAIKALIEHILAATRRKEYPQREDSSLLAAEDPEKKSTAPGKEHRKRSA